MGLTIAEVAGVINVSVVFLQSTFPLLVTFILVGVTAHSSSAATWSVVARLLSGTWWPTILRTDASVTTFVSKRIIFISAFLTAGFLLLSLAAIVTPLGLYQSLSEINNDDVDFAHIQDKSAIGLGTLDRDDYNTTRLCGHTPIVQACPGQNHGFRWIYNESSVTDYLNITWDGPQDYISSAIPNNLTEIFSSGRDGNLSTVATPFDIQYRTYILGITPDNATRPLASEKNDSIPWNIDQQRPRTIGDLQTYENSLIANDYVIRDGIIADMKLGGIGFRNHTLPTNVYSGVEWIESLLWIEPETICVSNNISLEFRLSLSLEKGYGLTSSNLLIDHGGLLAAISKGKAYGKNRVQAESNNPDLYTSAEIGATLYNYDLAAYLNVTVNDNATSAYAFNRSQPFTPGIFSSTSFKFLEENDVLLSRFQMSYQPNNTYELASDIDKRVNGMSAIDFANRSWTAISSGVVLGAPLSIDSKLNGRNDPGGKYTAPVFSCATALKAYVKDVTFFLNQSRELNMLQVKAAVPRVYAEDQSPLWAVEKAGPEFQVQDMNSLWGIVGEQHKNNTNFWIQRSKELYLPAGAALYSGIGSLYTENYFAFDSDANSFPVNGLSMLYDLANVPAVLVEFYNAPYYNGQYLYPLMQQWLNLTQSNSTVPTVMSLIWTDLMINSLTSRRSQLNANLPSVSTADEGTQQSVPDSVSVRVMYYSATVRYRPVFAIPAAIFLFVYLVILGCATVLRISKRSTLAILRSYVNQTSVGRAVLAERYASGRIRAMASDDWAREYGAEDIGIRSDPSYELLEEENIHLKQDVELQSIDTAYRTGEGDLKIDPQPFASLESEFEQALSRKRI